MDFNPLMLCSVEWDMVQSFVVVEGITFPQALKISVIIHMNEL